MNDITTKSNNGCDYDSDSDYEFYNDYRIFWILHFFFK